MPTANRYRLTPGQLVEFRARYKITPTNGPMRLVVQIDNFVAGKECRLNTYDNVQLFDGEGRSVSLTSLYIVGSVKRGTLIVRSTLPRHLQEG